MNCEYCACALPDEWHPNCKQCGAPRKGRDIDTLALRVAQAWDPADNIFFPDSWSWVEFNTGRQ